MNIPCKESKLEGPCTRITFLGVMIDTEAISVSVPLQKRQKIHDLLADWVNKKWGVKKELQSLVGSLIWLCQVLPQGRPFIQRFIKAQEAVKNPHHHVRITKPMIADIKWWDNMIKKWPGTQLIEDRIWWQPDIYNLYTDASNIGGRCHIRRLFHGI